VFEDLESIEKDVESMLLNPSFATSVRTQERQIKNSAGKTDLSAVAEPAQVSDGKKKQR